MAINKQRANVLLQLSAQNHQIGAKDLYIIIIINQVLTLVCIPVIAIVVNSPNRWTFFRVKLRHGDELKCLVTAVVVFRTKPHKLTIVFFFCFCCCCLVFASLSSFSLHIALWSTLQISRNDWLIKTDWQDSTSAGETETKINKKNKKNKKEGRRKEGRKEGRKKERKKEKIEAEPNNQTNHSRGAAINCYRYISVSIIIINTRVCITTHVIRSAFASGWGKKEKYGNSGRNNYSEGEGMLASYQ